jgi:hypothetical protein
MNIIEAIRSTRPNPDKKGHAFTVTFTKKDGTLRVMKARLGMRTGVTGKGMSFDPLSKGLLPAWELGNGFRMINLNTVKSVSIRDPKTHRREVYA